MEQNKKQTNLIQKHEPSRTLRSSNANLLYVPHSYSKFGDRKFSVCVPLLWNALPQHIKDVEKVLHFKRLLKTYFLPKHFQVEIRTVYLDMLYCNSVKLL